jgi:hypothetical protein
MKLAPSLMRRWRAWQRVAKTHADCASSDTSSIASRSGPAAWIVLSSWFVAGPLSRLALAGGRIASPISDV